MQNKVCGEKCSFTDKRSYLEYGYCSSCFNNSYLDLGHFCQWKLSCILRGSLKVFFGIQLAKSFKGKGKERPCVETLKCWIKSLKSASSLSEDCQDSNELQEPILICKMPAWARKVTWDCTIFIVYGLGEHKATDKQNLSSWDQSF